MENHFAQWNRTRAPFAHDARLVDLIRQQAESRPHQRACYCAQECLTYAELEAASNQLARHLMAAGVQTGDRVGICLPKSCRVVVAILAALKARAVYVPLDPDYPLDRLRYICQDAELRALLIRQADRHLTQQLAAPVIELDSIAERLAGLPTFPLDTGLATEAINSSQPNQRPSSLDAAYLIYTSGSTGQPKGVIVNHRSAVNFVQAMLHSPGFHTDDLLLSASTLSFDISVYDIFVPLAAGGSIYLLDRQVARDGRALAAELDRSQATIMFATPASWRMLIDAGWQGDPQRFRAFTGGEHLPRDLMAPLLARSREVWNFYGPTEATVLVTRQRIECPEERILVGERIENAQLFIVDDQFRHVGVEEAGELLIGGECLAVGYLNRPELDAERFVTYAGRRVYRTGDKCKFTADGRVECLGRKDDQVKLRGHRIELGEIEATLQSHPAVKQAAVTVRQRAGGASLIGYIVPQDGASLRAVDVSTYAASKLPDYMVPSLLLAVEAFPLLPNGKLDRQALPEPPQARPDLGFPPVPPQTDPQRKLAAIWAEILQLDRVGVTDNFFQLGGNSILAVKVLAGIEREIGWSISTPRFFDNPTIAQLCEVAAEAALPSDGPCHRASCGPSLTSPHDSDRPAIAIIGMAARFPGADNVQQFWRNLREGVESIRWFRPEELDPSVPATQRTAPHYVPARGVLEQAEYFDAAFFAIPPREAELIDPQQRIMLELAHTALEDAGHVSGDPQVRVGVWAGCFANTYYTHNILSHPDLVAQTGEFQLATYTEKDFVASRVAHKLDLRGPAVNVNTACSTSLVAVIEACQSLQLGHCEVALAGGATVVFPQFRGHEFQVGNILTPDGHCRPFDHRAQGTLFSDGAALVVLKRLSDAQRDGDRIYAVLRGFGINNDGGDKASFTAPSVRGQAAAIEMAHAMAGLPAESIEYIEAHGTATPLGDPIEVAALAEVFATRTQRRQYCGIGSVKSNIGHTVAAAGVAGLIKAALALYHEEIPPTLHFERTSDALPLEATPFFVCDQLRPWPRRPESAADPRAAGVSSFGVGGTNAHVILSEAPLPAPIQVKVDRPESAARQNSLGGGCSAHGAGNRPDDASPTSRPSGLCDARWPVQLWPFSAKSAASLDQYAAELTSFARSPEFQQASVHGIGVAGDVAYTLQSRRRAFAHRGFAIVDGDATQAGDTLQHWPRTRCGKRQAVYGPVPLAWMFPGQGAQYLRMGSELYAYEPVFRHTLDSCCDQLVEFLGRDLRQILFPPAGEEVEAGELLGLTRFTQPAIFSISYALAQMWQSWGLRPTYLIGHSIGEFVAACLAGVFSLADSLKLIARRGEIIQDLAGGCMLSVRAEAAQLQARLPSGCSIAAINSPSLCVVAGPSEVVLRLAAELTEANMACRQLLTSHAFHSPMMDAAVEPFTRYVADVPRHAPQLPIMSTVTGGWLSPDQAQDPRYWGQHLRSAVDFSRAISTLVHQTATPPLALLEIGPRATLATLAKQHVSATELESLVVVPTLSDSAEPHAELAAVLHAAGSLWAAGVPLAWDRLQPSAAKKPVSLPPYAFQRKRYFIDPRPGNVTHARCPVDSQPTISLTPTSPTPMPTTRTANPSADQRQAKIRETLQQVFENSSGIDLTEFDSTLTFLEIGLDSLVLTQTAAAMKREFALEVTFRQMLEQTPTPDSLVTWLDQQLPADKYAAAVAEDGCEAQPLAAARAGGTPAQNSLPANPCVASPPTAVDGSVQAIVQQQLQLMQQQLMLLGGAAFGACSTKTQATPPSNSAGADDEAVPHKAFGAQARVNLNSTAIAGELETNLREFIARYNQRTPGSKAYVQQHRRYLADPRTVSGFQPALKEMTYPIVVARSQGAYLWDIDGHQYLDLSCGFGSNFFGHSPDFMVSALSQQLATGYEIGPQSVLAGEVARMFCDMTGNERVAFCNTGSEAVLGALRLARTVSGRDRFVMFTGDYHGILDEVIVRSNKKLATFPAASGIPKSAVQNAIVLEYGSDEALAYIAREMDNLAAVIVESVQSRRPDFQPREFLQRLRQLTDNQPTALIFDEVITGFRLGPRGAQGHFGVQADLGTYGKVIGGGMPIGVIAGKAHYMDALDGGFWQFGDDSKPEVGMTYFAGTFVRHPLALAAAKQTMLYLQREGDQAYAHLNRLSDKLDRELQLAISDSGVPLSVARCFSLFKLQLTEELPYGDLLFASLRRRGIHIWEHRPLFLTLAHTEADIDWFMEAFRGAVAETQELGFLPRCGLASLAAASPAPEAQLSGGKGSSPSAVDGKLPAAAKRGKDRSGQPAWFIPDTANPGQFIQITVPSSS